VKLAVIGANGQLGSDLCAELIDSGHGVSRLHHSSSFDVRDAALLSRLAEPPVPDVVINTAAMHHVELCENDPGGSFAVNAVGARNVAEVCAAVGARLVHISTDYVFGGGRRTPYVECDLPKPVNVYGASKLAGEHLVLALNAATVVIRSSGLYGRSPCRAKGESFVDLMLRLGRERDEVRVVTDETLTPTCTVDLARQVVALLESEAPGGVYHATAQGACTWYEFAAEIFRLSGATARLAEAAPGEFPSKVPRPSYSVLENSRLAGLGLDRMPPWIDGLRRFLDART
jgi:dTDP-4-dehydrorhamnose reductase